MKSTLRSTSSQSISRRTSAVYGFTAFSGSHQDAIRKGLAEWSGGEGRQFAGAGSGGAMAATGRAGS